MSAKLDHIPEERRKSIIFTMRISPEQEQWLMFSSQVLAELLGMNPRVISKGFVIQKLMEFGKDRFEQWVLEMRDMSYEERQRELAS